MLKFLTVPLPKFNMEPKIMLSKRNLLSQAAIFRFHVKLWEGIHHEHRVDKLDCHQDYAKLRAGEEAPQAIITCTTGLTRMAGQTTPPNVPHPPEIKVGGTLGRGMLTSHKKHKIRGRHPVYTGQHMSKSKIPRWDWNIYLHENHKFKPTSPEDPEISYETHRQMTIA